MPCIKEESIHEIVIEKSRFITYLNRVTSEDEAKTYIQTIKKMHPTATHHCTAYIFGEHNEFQKSSDDGEPSGTAGVPMLESLKKNNMQDTLAVVVRYFGGIKLGAGGLIRAYSKSVSNAIASSKLVEKRKMLEYNLEFSYDMIGIFDYYFAQHHIPIINKQYEEKVTYTYLCDHDLTEDLMEMGKGQIKNSYQKECFVEVDI